MSTDYSIKVDAFQDGVAKIKNDDVLCSYKNSKENFIFDLAQEDELIFKVSTAPVKKMKIEYI